MTEKPDEFVSFSLESILETILFVASEPVQITELAECLGRKSSEIETGLKNLDLLYRQGRGLSIQWHAGRVQLTTAPELSSLIEKFLGLEATARLSRAALETLAIAAYRQPITRPAIDSVRGVNSDGVIKSLLSKGLIQEVGRSEGPGRPILYVTTAEFLQIFGLNSLNQLPPLALEESNVPTNGDSGPLKD